MAKIKFYLASPNQNVSSIYARISYGAFNIVDGKKVYMPLKYYIAESINPEFWNVKTCRVNETRKYPTFPEFNHRLDSIESEIKKLLYKIKNDQITPTIEDFKQRLDQVIKPESIQLKIETKQLTEKEKIQQMSLFEFIDYYLKIAQIKHSTYKGYNTTRNSLLDYQEKKRIKLSFKNIDIDFYSSYIDFLQKQNLSKNTIGQRIKVIKALLREATDRDIEVSQDYKKKSFKRINETSDTIYLNESELMKLYNIETSPESMEILKKEYHRDTLPTYLDRARDLFLVGCWTGLRMSDYSRLSSDNIKDGKIEITTKKTEQKVVIPIHKVVNEILMKYNYQFPKSPTNQVFNRFIKDVAKIAGINEPITTEITKGGLKVAQSTEKYNLVTSHTARRSFATNAFLADMPSISIMKITGHKTESAFMKYIKMSAKDNAIKMQSHKFFNPMLIAK